MGGFVKKLVSKVFTLLISETQSLKARRSEVWREFKHEIQVKEAHNEARVKRILR